MNLDPTMRLVVGVACFALVALYVWWRWKRAGHAMEAGAAHRAASSEYFEMLKHDPRWQQLDAIVRQRYAVGQPHEQSTHAYHFGALVCDKGFTYRLDSAAGPSRIVALVVRGNPADSRYVSMDLATGEVREDPAPHGWTYVMPPR